MTFSGLFAPVPTPFDEADRVDAGKLRRAFTRWLASPLTGFVVLGSNGEAPLLDEEETDHVVGEARASVPSNRPFIVGTGRESTRAAIHATKRAATLGADAVLVRTPGFFKAQMTDDVLVHHYLAVADESPVPVLLYNFTAVTGVNLAASAVARLASHPNIVGMKESGGDIAQMAALVAGTPAEFQVLAGSATTFYASLCVGASGGVLALACVLPEACAALMEHVRAGRHEEARVLQQRLMPLARLLGSVHGVPGLKAALALTGLDVGRPRPPLEPANESTRAALQLALARHQEVPA